MELARIGKYEIVSRIGQGAMGEVYKAHDPVLNRFVAIKTMTGVLTADDDPWPVPAQPEVPRPRDGRTPGGGGV